MVSARNLQNVGWLDAHTLLGQRQHGPAPFDFQAGTYVSDVTP